jgi:hypothetical protein
MKEKQKNTTKESAKAGSAGPTNLRRESGDDTEKKGKLPGEYPPQEDIMNRRDQQRVGLDVENLSRTLGPENMNLPNEPVITDRNIVIEEPELGSVDDIEQSAARDMERPVPKDINLDNETSDLATANESDVTQEDLQALGPKDLSMDGGEDELLKNRVWPVDMAGQDLDVPGSEDEEKAENESAGREDEENDFYSLGGDAHEDNLEGK